LGSSIRWGLSFWLRLVRVGLLQVKSLQKKQRLFQWIEEPNGFFKQLGSSSRWRLFFGCGSGWKNFKKCLENEPKIFLSSEWSGRGATASGCGFRPVKV
jgi:hypothetical protein